MALQLNPHHSRARTAVLPGSDGCSEEALQYLENALRLDPKRSLLRFRARDALIERLRPDVRLTV